MTLANEMAEAPRSLGLGAGLRAPGGISFLAGNVSVAGDVLQTYSANEHVVC